MIYIEQQDLMDFVYCLIGIATLYVIYLILKKVLKKK